VSSEESKKEREENASLQTAKRSALTEKSGREGKGKKRTGLLASYRQRRRNQGRGSVRKDTGEALDLVRLLPEVLPRIPDGVDLAGIFTNGLTDDGEGTVEGGVGLLVPESISTNKGKAKEGKGTNRSITLSESLFPHFPVLVRDEFGRAHADVGYDTVASAGRRAVLMDRAAK
jgi:hypothetical protein